MKVSTKLFNQQQLKQFTSLNEEIQKTQNKISTGKNLSSVFVSCKQRISTLLFTSHSLT